MCRVRVRPALLLAVAAAALTGCNDYKSPTAPERHGFPAASIACDNAPAGNVTICRAPVSCSLYPCASGTPSDITFIGAWSVDDLSVARILSPGAVQSVGVGHTVLRIKWEGYSDYFIAIGVFPGTAPLHTYEYEGIVWDGGAPPRTPLDGARVEILDGLPAGRSTTSGAMPDMYPGATPVRAPGHYGFFGIPSGTYRLRVSKNGYETQEVDTRQFADVTLMPAK